MRLDMVKSLDTIIFPLGGV